MAEVRVPILDSTGKVAPRFWPPEVTDLEARIQIAADNATTEKVPPAVEAEVASVVPGEVASQVASAVPPAVEAEVGAALPGEVAGQLPPLVTAEVASQVPPAVASEVAAELPAAVTGEVAAQVPPAVAAAVPPAVASEVAAELPAAVTAEVSAQVPPAVTAEVAAELPAAVSSEVAAQVPPVVTAEVAAQVPPAVVAEVADQVAPVVEAEVAVQLPPLIADAVAGKADTSALTAHESDTTNVHGIADTSALVVTTDSRLSDARTPTAHAASHGSAGGDPITVAQSQVTNLTTDLASKVSNSLIGVANGVASLDSAGQVPAAQVAGRAPFILNNADPNATVPVQYIAANDAATHVDVALVPKGNGALMADVPDGTTTGGNKRGANAVDLQLTRWNASRIASGTASALVGGINNATTGPGAAVVGGYNSTATADNALVLCASDSTANASGSSVVNGANNTASGVYSSVIGSSGSTASGLRATVVGGGLNIASGLDSFAHGASADTMGVPNAKAHGLFFNLSGYQSLEVLLLAATSNATATPMSARADGVQNYPVLFNNSAAMFKVYVTATTQTGAAAKAWEITGLIRRGANAASTVIVGTPTVTVVAADSGASAWTVSATANTTQGGLQVNATGAASTNIRWTAHAHLTISTYA